MYLNLANMRISVSRGHLTLTPRELNSRGETEIISLLVLFNWRLLQGKLEIMAMFEDFFFLTENFNCGFPSYLFRRTC